MFMKKTEFRTLKVLLALLFMCSAQLLYAYDCEVDGIWYNLNTTNKTASVTYKSSPYFADREYKGIVYVPEKVEFDGATYSVTSIGMYAFYNCSELTEVVIPNSVTEIGQSAFSYCRGLTEIVIPNSVTEIGRGTFSGCTGLTKVVIPNSVIAIGEEAFSGCI